MTSHARPRALQIVGRFGLAGKSETPVGPLPAYEEMVYPNHGPVVELLNGRGRAIVELCDNPQFMDTGPAGLVIRAFDNTWAFLLDSISFIATMKALLLLPDQSPSGATTPQDNMMPLRKPSHS